MEILPPIRKNIMEPKVYALLVKTKGGQVLHLGVHYSLDEAYSAARTKIEKLDPGISLDAVDIDLWNSLSTKNIIPQLLDVYMADMSTEKPITQIPIEDIKDMPNVIRSLVESNKEALIKDITTEEYVEGFKNIKNELMKRLIEEANLAKVDDLKSLLGPGPYKYVVSQINKKTLEVNSEIKK